MSGEMLRDYQTDSQHGFYILAYDSVRVITLYIVV